MGWFVILWKTSSVSAIDEVFRTFVFLAMLLGGGVLVEGLGTRIEANVLDGRRENASPGHMDNWHRFLLLEYDSEPAGHRYLRGLVQRLKFELNTATAVLIALPSIPFLVALDPANATGWIVGAVSGGCVAALLLKQASGTHALLSDTRAMLVSRYWDETHEHAIPSSQLRDPNEAIALALLIFAAAMLLAVMGAKYV